MLNLSSLTLLRNAKKLVEEAEHYIKDPVLLKGCHDLTTALNHADLTAPVFSNTHLPKFALLAYQCEQISEAQLTSVLLYWEAKQDYPDSHMTGLKVHKLTSDDYTTQRVLSQYLRIQSITVGFVRPYIIADGLEDDVHAKIIQQLLSDEVPSSERCFFTFEINENEPSAKMFMELNNVGFNFFMPINRHGKMLVIIPSYTMIQTALNYLAHPKKLVSRIGDDTFDDVFKMHENDQHPLGLSSPGFEKKEADSIEAGMLGFSLHDVYHIVLLSYTPHIKLFIAFIKLAQSLHSSSECNSNHVQECINTMIDNEFRLYTKGKVLNQLQSDERKELIHSKEVTIIVALIAILSKDILDYYLFKYMNEWKQVPSQRDELMHLNSAKSLPNKLKFIQHLIVKLFEMDGTLNHEHINLAQLLDLVVYDAKLRKAFLNTESTSFSPNEITPDLIAKLKSLEEIRNQFISFYNDPNNQQNNPWLKKHNEYKSRLISAVTCPDLGSLQGLFTEKTYQKYIAHIDRVRINAQTLADEAVRLRHVNVLKLLIAEGAQLNAAMLLTALRNNDLEMMRTLLEAGVNAYTLDEENLSVIDYCLESGNTEALKLLLNYSSLSQRHLEYLKFKTIKIHTNCIPLLDRYKEFKNNLYVISRMKSDESKLELLTELVSSNKDNFSYATLTESDAYTIPDNNEKHAQADSGMRQPFITCLKLKEEWQILCKQQKINVNQKTSDGATPLHYVLAPTTFETIAIALNKHMLFERMIDYGADVTAVTEDGDSCLKLALQDPDLTMIKMLQERGARFSMQKEYAGYVGVLLDILDGNQWSDHFKQVLALLVANGFDLNKKIVKPIGPFEVVTVWSMLRGMPVRSSKTVLFIDLDMPLEIRMLCIQLGAHPNELSFDGKLELSTAIENGWNDYFMFLLAQNANPNLADCYGNSPMHVAAKKGDVNAMKILRDHGAKSFANEEGKTPEDFLAFSVASSATIQIGLFKSKESEGHLAKLESPNTSTIVPN